MSDIQNKALYIYFQLRKAIDISNSQVAQKLIISRSTKEIPTKNSTIYYSIQVTITQLMDRAKRNLEILFSPWYSSSFFFFPSQLLSASSAEIVGHKGFVWKPRITEHCISKRLLRCIPLPRLTHSITPFVGHRCHI